MPRPRTSKPKRNLVSFRLTDEEFSILKTMVEHTKLDGETFSETVGRAVKWFIAKECERQIKTLRETKNSAAVPVVSVTTEHLTHWHKDA